ncbi:MAG: 4Fe-4S dicluster domain-containing protein [bacterium]
MSKKISRRSFLKEGISAFSAIAASGIVFPGVVEGAGQKELATLIDIRKCIGCEACVEACQETNKSKFPEPKKPFPRMYPDRVKVADWSENRDVTDRLIPYNWVFIQRATIELNGESFTYTFPRRCMHCQNPPCANLCPFGAARKLKNGITLIHSGVCLGGSKCKSVCPWQIPERQTGVGIYLNILPPFVGNGVMFKCDRCYNRIEKGELPACIEICPTQVQKIGPREEMVREAHDIAREINGYIYGERENGGTNTIYVSPVSFEELNKRIEKGPGKPHLGPVPNLMAHTDNLAKAMLIAPFAGMATSGIRFLKYLKES